MKEIAKFLFSSRLMAVILIIFAASIATATFIENDFGSQTARAVVYNSWWFNLLLFAGIINLGGTIILRKMYSKGKRSLFLFHLAFLLVLTGAAITHFFGFEGSMHLRAGELSNRMISDDIYLRASATAGSETATIEKQIYFSSLSNNYHKLKLSVAGKRVTIECLEIVPNAEEMVQDDPHGEPILELVLAGNNGRQTLVLASGQTKLISDLPFSFNDTSNRTGISIISNRDNLAVKTPFTARVMNMATQTNDTVGAHTYQPFRLHALYNFRGIQVVAKSYNPRGKVSIATAKDAKPDQNPDALYLKFSSGEQSRSMVYFTRRNALNQPANITLNDMYITVSYGAKMVTLPFLLRLNQFIIERYPGSKSPSWFESRILLKDSSRNIAEERRVFMNNILKHRGYRFFQSSYDTDEQGTILSVNHDYWGTLLTYLGYVLLALGMIFSLANPNSRFRKLSLELAQLRGGRGKDG
ncbi:MAG TPA: cytochrome c biogenesis protein ResB [Bacteroidales bacterium]